MDFTRRVVATLCLAAFAWAEEPLLFSGQSDVSPPAPVLSGTSTPAPDISSLMAPAPGPGSDNASGEADGVFTTIASQAVFTNASTVVLQGVTNTTTWVQYSPSVRSGTLTQEYFTGPNMMANGSWLGGEGQAALYGQLNNTAVVIALQLRNAQLSPDRGSISFQYTVADNTTVLALDGGVVDDVLTAASDGAGDNTAQLLAKDQLTQSTIVNATLLTDASGIPSYLPGAGTRLILLGLGGYGYGGYYNG